MGGSTPRIRIWVLRLLRGARIRMSILRPLRLCRLLLVRGRDDEPLALWMFEHARTQYLL